MDDFIYILLGVAWIGYSIYSSQKKLKEKQQKARRSGEQSQGQSTKYTEESKPKSFIDRLFEEFEEKPEPSYEEIGNEFDVADQERQKVEQPQREIKDTKYQSGTYSVEDARTVNDIVESNSDLSSDYFKQKSRSSARKRDEEWEERKKKHYQTSFYDEETDEDDIDFDLRQAVIFSEILNRPKYLEGSVM